MQSTATLVSACTRAELAARDVTIQHQREQIAQLEAGIRRLRTALQVLTGCPVPEAEVTGPGRSDR